MSCLAGSRRIVARSPWSHDRPSTRRAHCGHRRSNRTDPGHVLRLHEPDRATCQRSSPMSRHATIANANDGPCSSSDTPPATPATDSPSQRQRRSRSRLRADPPSTGDPSHPAATPAEQDRRSNPTLHPTYRHAFRHVETVGRVRSVTNQYYRTTAPDPYQSTPWPAQIIRTPSQCWRSDLASASTNVRRTSRTRRSVLGATTDFKFHPSGIAEEQ
jgi:hypothetical protein